MATRRKPRDQQQNAGGPVRRPRGERKRLDPAYEELASGAADRLRRPRRPRLRDDRPVRLVPGVKNADARMVFEARFAKLEAIRKEHPGDPTATERLGRLLAEAWALELWRGRSLTSFDALVSDLLDLDAGEARALAERAAKEAHIPIGEITEEAVAAWMRAEAALVEADLKGHVWVSRSGAHDRLHVELPANTAVEGLAAIGRRALPLARERRS